jgi:hypothetical protein
VHSYLFSLLFSLLSSLLSLSLSLLHRSLSLSFRSRLLVCSTGTRARNHLPHHMSEPQAAVPPTKTPARARHEVLSRKLSAPQLCEAKGHRQEKRQPSQTAVPRIVLHTTCNLEKELPQQADGARGRRKEIKRGEAGQGKHTTSTRTVGKQKEIQNALLLVSLRACAQVPASQPPISKPDFSPSTARCRPSTTLLLSTLFLGVGCCPCRGQVLSSESQSAPNKCKKTH